MLFVLISTAVSCFGSGNKKPALIPLTTINPRFQGWSCLTISGFFCPVKETVNTV